MVESQSSKSVFFGGGWRGERNNGLDVLLSADNAPGS